MELFAKNMLKKWLCLFYLVLVALPAAFSYGHSGGLFLWEDNQNKPNKNYLSYKFIHQKEISFCTKGSAEDWERPISAEILSRYFQAAFWEWTRGTAQYLRQSGRAEEFADIIALLEKPFKLVDLGVCQKNMAVKPDIEISAYPPFQSNKAWAYYAQYGMRFGADSQIHFVYQSFKTTDDLLPQKKDVVETYIQNAANGAPTSAEITLDDITQDQSEFVMLGKWKIKDNYRRKYHDQLFTAMLHEVGHAFGLGDEDKKLRVGQSSPGPISQYGADADQRQVFRTPYFSSGLMSYNVYYARRTADDVMGLITIFDRFTGTKRIIYPLLSDEKEPEVGAIVFGQYKYPPVKKGKNALRNLKKYFIPNEYPIFNLRVYGPKVFEREFSPVPGYPAKYRHLSDVQKKELDKVKKQLIEHLQKEHK